MTICGALLPHRCIFPWLNHTPEVVMLATCGSTIWVTPGKYGDIQTGVPPADRIEIGHAEVMRLFFLAALALPVLPGQPKDLNQERDADGFGNIKWGMTVAEAKATFPGLRESQRSELTSGAFEERLIQPVLMIGSVEMIVSIQTKADSDVITRIVLKLAPFVQHRKTAFQFLSNNLIQKYGKPSHHDKSTRGRIKEETEVWVLPSTTITLDWREESAGKLRLLDITYETGGAQQNRV